jgi:hypothetical protein
MTKSQVQNLINTNLASGGGSTGGVTALKQRQISTAILNYAEQFTQALPLTKGTKGIGDVASNGTTVVVGFSESLDTANYRVIGSLVSIGNASDDTTVHWTVRNKNVNGFSLILRESGNITQNLQFDYVVFRSTTPVSTLDAVDDSVTTTNNNATININPFGNDDAGFTPTNITAIDTTGFTLGALTINPDAQSIQFVPNGTFGSGTFTYTIQDVSGVNDTATINVTVPSSTIDANDDSRFILNNSTSIDINPLVNDDDGIDATISSVNLTGFTLGNVTINSTGTLLSFVPNGNVGESSFKYTITDTLGYKSTANISITIPESTIDAVNDAFTTVDNSSVVNYGLFGNDDVGYNDITITAINTTGFTLGTVSINSGGQTVKFTPNGTTGSSSFTYTATDDSNTSDTATVTITVPDSNIEASNYNVSKTNNSTDDVLLEPLTSGNIVLGYEPTTITSINLTGFTLGNVVINSGNETLTFTPNGTVGDQTFTYTITDSSGASNTGNINISIPLSTINAVNDSVTRLSDVGSFLYNPFGNDNLGYEPTIITSVNSTGFTLGTVSIHSGQQLINVTSNGNVGTSTFTYTITDSSGTSDTATISVTINAPTIECFQYTVTNTSFNNRTVNYTTCAGVASSLVLAGGDSVSLGCVRKNSITGNSLIIGEEESCS